MTSCFFSIRGVTNGLGGQQACIVSDSGEEPSCGDVATRPPAAAGVRAGRVRATAAAWMGCALGSGAAYVLQDRAAVAAGLAVAVMIVACAAVGLGAVLLGGGDHRSPFVRCMLLVCVLTGRPPGEYLPPGPGEH
jgi:hypothetical protein